MVNLFSYISQEQMGKKLCTPDPSDYTALLNLIITKSWN
jgi:hypothetical protein